MNRTLLSVTFLSLAVFFFSSPVAAQTTSLKFQGQLEMSSTPADGNFDFEFLLFDALAGGGQVGTTEVRNGVNVANGSFSVDLNFGGVFSGPERFLEIRIKPSGGVGFTILAPRQPVRSAPYSIRSLTAATADSVAVNGIPGGSGNYIQNSTTQQASSDFNISGNGTAGGSLNGNIVNAATQYNIGGSRLLSSGGTNNLFVGLNAGDANTGMNNTFVGKSAGMNNSSGFANTFVGSSSGLANTIGDYNSFLGYGAGNRNTNGYRNTFVGALAGFNNASGNDNSYFGFIAGQSSNGSRNSFFGSSAGGATSSGSDNSFFGANSGQSNTLGNKNSFFGTNAGYSTMGGSDNSFFGYESGRNNSGGLRNSFFGARAGFSSLTTGNTFIGYEAGLSTQSGGANVFVGLFAGDQNQFGSNNTALGAGADLETNDLFYATAIGSESVVSTSNTIALGRPNGADKVIAYGRARVGMIPLEASAAQVCFNAFGDLLQCGASSLKWKTDVRPLDLGLKTILALQPISYLWKETGTPDIGLGAENVADVAPELTFFDSSGQAKGVKYDRITLVLVNAIKEQQDTIEVQRSKLEIQGKELIRQSVELDKLRSEFTTLKMVVCASNRDASICQ